MLISGGEIRVNFTYEALCIILYNSKEIVTKITCCIARCKLDARVHIIHQIAIAASFHRKISQRAGWKKGARLSFNVA